MCSSDLGRLVHRKKDSKDWGVDPKIVVPIDSKLEEQLFKEESDLDVLHGPLPKTTTLPTTQPATTQPSTQPSDPQLDAAIEEVTKMTQNGGKFVQLNIPATTPSTEPATVPAQ